MRSIMGRKNSCVSRLAEEKTKLAKKKRKKRNRRRAPMTEAQQELATRYLPLARALARPLKAAWPTETDEFDSAACLALVEAAQSYDPSRKVIFPTFARYRIWGALRDVQRDLITAGWRCDLEHAPVLTSLIEGIEEHGRVLNTEPDRPVEEELDSRDAVEHLLRKLPKQYAAACREIYVNNRTQSQAASMIGCSKSRVSYLLKESRAMLNDSARWKDPDGEWDLPEDEDDEDRG
jgi:RNA polymerase sigma factor (sigma-70 family)